MNEAGYSRIIEALESGRRALARARATAGVLRVLGIFLATLGGLVFWAVIQRALGVYSVPLATAASVAGAGLLVFALVRWLVLPLVRMPGRDAFVALLERRYPAEKNLIVNAYQLGDAGRESQAGQAPDLVDQVVERASRRIREMNLEAWRDPRPDRPFLWAGGAALVAMALLAVLSPTLLTGALGQVIRPSEARPPEVTLQVLPGDVEVDRGADVPVRVTVDGTGEAPVLRFRERSGEWRSRTLGAEPGAVPSRRGGAWQTVLPEVDRYLEYQVEAPRAQSPVFTIQVRETPRLAGFRAHLTYPAYTRLPQETLDSGTGDLAAIKGTQVDLRVLTNRPLAGGYLDWRADRESEATPIELVPVDPTTFQADLTLMQAGSYAVVLRDEAGEERLRSPRYRIDPVADRAPHLTVHFPQEDHDLAEDMMERIVADAADDFGFSAVRVRYRIDEGKEASEPYTPFTAGQKEFRLDTLWDLGGLNLFPGAEVTYYLEVWDNDTVSGPKAVRSAVRRVRFPTVGEIYEEVAADHEKEIDTLSEMHEAQQDFRKRIEKLDTDLKRGKELNWETRQEVQKSLEQQAALEDQLSQIVERLQGTLDKAANRAQMNQDLVQKMSEINQLLDKLSNEDLKRSFRELSRALERMDKNAIRRALENLQVNQDQMLRGMDRTIELLKQIRREEQMADVVQRSDEIARLQEEIARQLEKMGMTPEDLAAKMQDPKAGPEAKDGTEAKTDPAAGDPADADPDRDPADGDPDRTPPGETREAAGEEPGASDETAQATEAESSESEPGAEAGETPDGETGKTAESEASEDATKQDQAAEEADPAGNPGDESPSEASASEETSDSKESQKSGESQSGSEATEPQAESQETGGESESGETPESAESKEATPEERQQLEQLAKQQQQAEAQLEELKRMLRTLQKLMEQEDQQMAQDLSELEQSKAADDLGKNMNQAQQSMSSGKKPQAAAYAFRAQEDARELANMARRMQQQQAMDQEEENTEMVERLLHGLIGVSRVQEELVRGSEDTRELAQRQLGLVETTEALAESLQTLMSKTFAIQAQNEQSSLDKAISKMTAATQMFEQGSKKGAEHQARESAGDINETIVQLMQSQAQMCGGQGQGSAQAKMQGLSEGQQGLNESTRKLMERLANQGRLSRTDEQRMQQLAAQQEMIRKGLEELNGSLEDAKEMLGDLDQVGEDMESVEQELKDQKVDPRLLERQQQILSRLLDAQRSIRQREMSLERQSRTGTLASRSSPPPLPEDLLRQDRTLEEDVLRGANDRYPAQYRKLVEEYFRALSRENRTP